ncbi:MAG: GntR family transcriptional regulator [Gemmobacter sp.]|jgi:DNA-binding GntR family transcriptional regulator|nr:GntR family transcriptional regulator [Gemmobacter sp.]
MALTGVDVSQRASASDIVFEALRRAIITGEMKDGDPLRQDAIARLFNTSRIPVREALTMLEQQGLVQTRRYKGAVVTGLSVDDADEIFDFRYLVEAHVIRAAVPRMTPGLLAEAGAICEALAVERDPQPWGDLNRAFHATLLGASGLSFHLAALGNAMDRLDRYVRAQLLLTEGHERSNTEHRAILAACAAGDADGAADLTVAHIHGAHQSLRAHLDGIKAGFGTG